MIFFGLISRTKGDRSNAEEKDQINRFCWKIYCTAHLMLLCSRMCDVNV